MSFTGFSFSKEGFYDFNPNPITNSDINKNIQVLKDESKSLDEKDLNITTNYNLINNSIIDYNRDRAYMQLDSSKNITKYNTINVTDKTDMTKTTFDVRKEDINIMLLQQNYIYILGSVTCATLLIAAVMIGRNRE